ncbi:MAG: aminotransferase class III-fold pyridoxal phosphate-dependent enzyme [Defluviimonas denitrificans]
MSKSHLFYQSDTSRPVLAEARGIYMWDVDGRRYIDGSSGAMVSNIGHSNPNVLEAMRRQMEKSTFGYRLHFETEPGEHLAAKVASLTPRGWKRCSSCPADRRPWKARSSWRGNMP